MCQSDACGCGGSTLPLGAMAAVVAAGLAVPAAMAVLAVLAPGLWAVAAIVAGLDAVAVAGLVWLVRRWRPERPVFTQAARRPVAGGPRRALPARAPLAIEAGRPGVVPGVVAGERIER